MDRFGRQRIFLGSEGHDRLRATHVGVVGLGGLGSHVVQQLAYLGVGTFTLVDPDRLEETNRNRLVGARATDPIGMAKTAIAQRLATETDPAIAVVRHDLDLRHDDAFRALQQVDWLFGCVDNDGARLLLTQMSAERGQPYVDLATEIHVAENGLDYGGRVCVSWRGGGCPFCLDLLSQDDIRRSLADEQERRDIAGIYGVDVAAPGEAGPAVVYLNGVVASLGVAEFAAAVAGLRDPAGLLEYRGMLGVVVKPMDEAAPDCPYCAPHHARAS